MRQKKLVVAALVLLIAGLVGVGMSKAVTRVPPGVSREMWLPLSDGVGIAILPGRAFEQHESIVGTLMIRKGNRWRAVNLVPGPPGMVPVR